VFRDYLKDTELCGRGKFQSQEVIPKLRTSSIQSKKLEEIEYRRLLGTAPAAPADLKGDNFHNA
jgi:hypothetical protein